MIDMNQIVGTHDIVMITLDTLRYDVAKLEEANCPNLCADGPWEKRHTPGSFTYAAHHAFFGGFLPTPANTDKASHVRLFHTRNTGLKTHPYTWQFDAPDIVSGLAAEGYRTICIGGVIFFTKKNKLAKVLPGYFQESYWRMTFGVTNPRSTEHQVQHALKLLERANPGQRLFLFLNVSAIHGPNHYFIPGARRIRPRRSGRRCAMWTASSAFCSMRCVSGAKHSAWRSPIMAPPMAKMAITGIALRTRSYGMCRTGSFFCDERGEA